MSFVTKCIDTTTKSQQEPIALAIYKRGKQCIVAKLTKFPDGEMVLGIAIKGQQGTEEMLSLPLQVIEYARQHSVLWLYWRRDRYPMEMRRVKLEILKQEGYLQQDGEVYFPLAAMESVPWRQWEYAEKIVRLTPEVNEDMPDRNVPKQLALVFEGVGDGN